MTIIVFNGYTQGSDGDMRVLSLLTDTFAYITDQLSYGDKVIPTGVFNFAGYGANWYSANANNHQQTWGVLASAITALVDLMHAYGEFGYAQFQIFDGGNQVGQGSLGPA